MTPEAVARQSEQNTAQLVTLARELATLADIDAGELDAVRTTERFPEQHQLRTRQAVFAVLVRVRDHLTAAVKPAAPAEERPKGKPKGADKAATV